MLVGPARRLLRLRMYLFLALAVLGVALSLFQDQIAERLAPPCEAAPAFEPDVDAAVRAQLETLFAHGLLYCAEPPASVAPLEGPIYWGADGMDSVLFFEATSLEGVGVPRYGYNDFEPPPAGDVPPRGYIPIRAGREAYANQAPAAGEARPDYFYRVQGAPSDTDSAVTIDILGPEREQAGVTGRDFWQDFTRLLSWLRRAEPPSPGSTQARVGIPIVPRRWEAVLRRQVTPELAGRTGQPTLDGLAKAPIDGPTLYQTASGLLGSAVWVAGVVTETTPALVLVPDAGGDELPARSATLWTSGGAGPELASFAFEPLPAGAVYEARFWADGRRQDAAPPDRTWRVTFP